MACHLVVSTVHSGVWKMDLLDWDGPTILTSPPGSEVTAYTLLGCCTHNVERSRHIRDRARPPGVKIVGVLIRGLMRFPDNTPMLWLFKSRPLGSQLSEIPVRYVRVDHSCSHILVAEKFLNCTDVVPALKKMRGKGMTPSRSC